MVLSFCATARDFICLAAYAVSIVCLIVAKLTSGLMSDEASFAYCSQYVFVWPAPVAGSVHSFTSAVVV
jgi:hypothetical protein